MLDNQEYLSVKDYGARWGFSAKTVREMIKNGQLEATMFGNHPRIHKDAKPNEKGKVEPEPEAKEPESPEAVELTGLDAELSKLEKVDLIEDKKIALAAKKLKFKTPEEYAQALQDQENRQARQDERGARQDEVDAKREERQKVLEDKITAFEQKGDKVAELAKLLEEIAEQKNQPEYDAYKVSQGMQAPYIMPSAIKNHWNAISLLLYEIAGIAKPIDEEEGEPEVKGEKTLDEAQFDEGEDEE